MGEQETPVLARICSKSFDAKFFVFKSEKAPSFKPLRCTVIKALLASAISHLSPSADLPTLMDLSDGSLECRNTTKPPPTF